MSWIARRRSNSSAGSSAISTRGRGHHVIDRREFPGALAGGPLAAEAAEAGATGEVYPPGMLERKPAATNAGNLPGFRQVLGGPGDDGGKNLVHEDRST